MCLLLILLVESCVTLHVAFCCSCKEVSGCCWQSCWHEIMLCLTVSKTLSVVGVPLNSGDLTRMFIFPGYPREKAPNLNIEQSFVLHKLGVCIYYPFSKYATFTTSNVH